MSIITSTDAIEARGLGKRSFFSRIEASGSNNIANNRPMINGARIV